MIVEFMASPRADSTAGCKLSQLDSSEMVKFDMLDGVVVRGVDDESWKFMGESWARHGVVVRGVLPAELSRYVVGGDVLRQVGGLPAAAEELDLAGDNGVHEQSDHPPQRSAPPVRREYQHLGTGLWEVVREAAADQLGVGSVRRRA